MMLGVIGSYGRRPPRRRDRRMLCRASPSYLVGQTVRSSDLHHFSHHPFLFEANALRWAKDLKGGGALR